MNDITLGNTGLTVSRLCYGTLTIGPMQANLSLDEGSDLIAYAIGQGIHFFDTAELYETYPYLREGMKKANKQDIVISSKTYAYTKELAVAAVEQARKELDRDYIDIFMLHEQESIHTLRGHMEALEYLMDCKAKGIIKAVGASMHHVAAVDGAVKLGLDVIHPMVNKNGLGIVDGTREDMALAVQKAYAANMGVFSMKPLGGGNLFKEASACLDYVLGLPYIHSVAIGMQCQDEIDANLHFWEHGCFDAKSLARVQSRKRQLHIDDWCEGCGNCIKRCGQSALSLENGMAVCDYSKCVLCGYCGAVCPCMAIKVV